MPKSVLFLQLGYFLKTQPPLYSAVIQMYVRFGSCGVIGNWSLYWDQVTRAIANVERSSLLKNVTWLSPVEWEKNTDNLVMFQCYVSYLRQHAPHRLRFCPNLLQFATDYPTWNRIVDCNDEVVSYEYRYQDWLAKELGNWNRLSEAGFRLVDGGKQRKKRKK